MIDFCGRNERGKEMLNLVKNLLEVTPTITSVWLEELCFLSSCRFIYEVFDCITNCFAQGNRRSYVMETVKADDKAKLGKRRSILFYFYTICSTNSNLDDLHSSFSTHLSLDHT